MNGRKIAGSTGTACLITAAIGFGLASPQDPQRTKLPETDKRFDAGGAARSIAQRGPLPLPSFGFAPVLDQRDNPAILPQTVKPKLLGTTSSFPLVVMAVRDWPLAATRHLAIDAIVPDSVPDAAASPTAGESDALAEPPLVLPEPVFGLVHSEALPEVVAAADMVGDKAPLDEANDAALETVAAMSLPGGPSIPLVGEEGDVPDPPVAAANQGAAAALSVSAQTETDGPSAMPAPTAVAQFAAPPLAPPPPSLPFIGDTMLDAPREMGAELAVASPPTPNVSGARVAVALPEPTFGLADDDTAIVDAPDTIQADTKEFGALTGTMVKRTSPTVDPDTKALTSAPGLPVPPGIGEAVISYQDELIMEVRVNDAAESDTIIAYGTGSGLYLPLGPIARILDLAITVVDEGRYASGWILDEKRTIAIDLRARTIELAGKTTELGGNLATAFDGEMYLRIDRFAELFPLKIKSDLRTQAVQIETLETFPFEERLARMVRRARLDATAVQRPEAAFQRVEAPYLALAIPTADIELRAVTDKTFGPRLEGDILLAGDLGYLSAESYLSLDSKNGATASLFRMGRVDPDAELLGPLGATSFALGDINSTTMPLGLRSIAGRGVTVTNAPSQVGSVFDRIDLRGILPDGYEVELYRNDILVGSTRKATNGQYEFLQVPVDFGLNVFRFVFFGPQGQRSEVVENVSVGDGRLAKGSFVYAFDAVQRDRNIFGVRAPHYTQPRTFGDVRIGGHLSYGLSSKLTTTLGGAWFEHEGARRWLATAGLRTSIAGVAIKADAGVADGGARALGGGLPAQLRLSTLTVHHSEYKGLFPDETVTLGNEFLRRSTEIDFNTAMNLGGAVGGLSIPLTARFRSQIAVDGRQTIAAGVRASARSGGLLFSNTMEYSRVTGPEIASFDQLLGNFDLATIGRSKTRGRLSLGYAIRPRADLVNANLEIDHSLDDRTSLRATAGYFFESGKPAVGVSGIRDFDKFSLAFDASYSFVDRSHFVGLRLGLSLGRDPLRGGLFVARPGMATSGGATLRAFRDVDGDGIYGPVDEPMEGVDVVSFNRTSRTDKRGIARLSGLGTGQPVSVQLDTSTLPDIDLAPQVPGIEIVPRPGLIQAFDYAVVSLSEIEGIARFEGTDLKRGVSGVRLSLQDTKGKIVGHTKTEVDGYYFFERVRPGKYTLQIDPDQIAQLQLCALDDAAVAIGHRSEVVSKDLVIRDCS